MAKCTQMVVKGSVGHQLTYLKDPQRPADVWTVTVANYNERIKLTRFERNRIEVSIPMPILLSLLDGTTPDIVREEFAIAVNDNYLLISVANLNLKQPLTPEQLTSNAAATNTSIVQPRPKGEANPNWNPNSPHITFQSTGALSQALVPIELLARTQPWIAGSGAAGAISNHNGNFELAYEYKLQTNIANASITIAGKRPKNDELQERIASLPEPIKEALYTPEELDRFMFGLGLMHKATEVDSLKEFQRVAIQNDWITELLALKDNPKAFQNRLERAHYWVINDNTWLTIKSPQVKDAAQFDLIVEDQPFNQAFELSQAHCPDSYFPASYQTLNQHITIYGYELSCERLKLVFSELYQHQQNGKKGSADS